MTAVSATAEVVDVCDRHAVVRMLASEADAVRGRAMRSGLGKRERLQLLAQAAAYMHAAEVIAAGGERAWLGM